MGSGSDNPRRSALQRDYDEEAARYDRVRFEKPSGQFVARLDAAIIRELLAMAGGSRLLDLPVGTGRALDYLNDRPLRIVGCDLTEGMLRFANTNYPCANEVWVSHPDADTWLVSATLAAGGGDVAVLTETIQGKTAPVYYWHMPFQIKVTRR